MMSCRLLLGLTLLTGSVAAQPKAEPLWPNAAPAAVGNEEADRPTLTIYAVAPDKAAGAAVIVFPGGGYVQLAMDHEGRQIAEWLNGLGISAFVLRYRHAPQYRHPVPLQDAQRAIRWVRLHAKEHSVKPDHIGIWGFSAGGHLASTAATHFDSGDPNAQDPVERMSSRPDLLVLAYPVISFTSEYSHKGSRRNLLGGSEDPKFAEELSNEKRVTQQTPPTFLFHTGADTGVPAENSVLFYLALRKAGVPAELHIYEQGRHGLGLAPTHPVLSSWPARLADWFHVRGFL